MELHKKMFVLIQSTVSIPLCKNCVHFRPYLMKSHIDYELSECAIFGLKDSPKNKKFIYNYEVLKCRKDESLCGKNGTFFVESNNNY